MSYNNSAQGFEAPFNLGDYVAFDFDFEAPETSQAMSIDNPLDANYAENFDTVFTGTSQHATPAASVDYSMMDALPTMSETNFPLEDFTVFERMPLAADVDTDALQNPSHSPSWLPPTLDFQPEPSRWVPVPPELQKQLNTTYAPQLDLLSCDPNPAPVLFLAAEDHLGSPAGSATSHPSGGLTVYGPPQTSEPRTGTASIDPSLLMRESTGLSPTRLPSYDTSGPSSSISEQHAPEDDALVSNTTTKRAFDAGETEFEPTSKRIRIAEAEPMVDAAEDTESEDDDDQVGKQVSVSQPDSLPVAISDVEAEAMTEAHSQDESAKTQEDDSDNGSDSSTLSETLALPPDPVVSKVPSALQSSGTSLKKNAYWRYEQANETDLRNERRNQWSNRLTNATTGAKGKTRSRKMQKLLEEIEDSQSFVEAQGFKAGEDVRGGTGARRPVRNGARKSYVGQE